MMYDACAFGLSCKMTEPVILLRVLFLRRNLYFNGFHDVVFRERFSEILRNVFRKRFRKHFSHTFPWTILRARFPVFFLRPWSFFGHVFPGPLFGIVFRERFPTRSPLFGNVFRERFSETFSGHVFRKRVFGHVFRERSPGLSSKMTEPVILLRVLFLRRNLNVFRFHHPRFSETFFKNAFR